MTVNSITPGRMTLVVLFGLLASLPPAAAQEGDAGPEDFTQPGYSTTIQGEGMEPFALNRADSDRMAIALASKYFSQGKFEEAVRIFSALHRRRPRDNNVESRLSRTETTWSRKLMAAQNYAGAMKVLSAAGKRRPGNRDVQILMAQSEVALDRPKDAIRRLEVLAPLHPDWPRPRVELSKAYAADGENRTAKRILITELGKKPPPHVRRNLVAAIRQLEDRQKFIGRFSVGVVPDSNITGGTYNDTVQFLGLPFTLNDDAKQKSGVRADIATGGTLRTGWKENSRLELSLDLHHSEPLGEEGTPNSNVRLATAVRRRWQKGSLRAGLVVQPFYWDNELQRIERSLFFEGGRRVSGPVSLVGNLTLSDGAFADEEIRDFRQWEAGLGPSIAVSRYTQLQLNGIFGIRNAESDLYSFVRRGISANLVTVPPSGWRVKAAAALTRDVYGEESLAFGVTQEDLVTGASVEVVKTGWVFLGFSPSLGLGYSEVRSSIDLFDKRSYSVILGVALPY